MLTASWRPAFIAVNLSLLAMIAYFGARLTNTMIAARLQGAPSYRTDPPAAAAPASVREPASAYAVIAERDVFNAVKGAPASEAAAAKRTELSVRLWGTVVDSDPSRSYAVIEDLAARTQALYRVGDLVLGVATLTHVAWDRVILTHDGDDEVLDLVAGSAEAGTPGRLAARAPTERIRRTTGNKFLIDRRELEKTVENMNEVFTQARAVPYFENGKTVGFRVFAIKSGSVFEKIGLKNGDVIERVNGVELTDPTKAITLFTELQNEGHIAVDLRRNKQSQSFSYEIR